MNKKGLTSLELIAVVLMIIVLSGFLYSAYARSRAVARRAACTNNLKQIYKKTSLLSIIYKTIGFTYLNPHVYSDTVFFLGNFSKNFLLIDKYNFAIGASFSSLLFFFLLGYLSKYFS